MRLKTLIALALAAVLVLSVAGCGDDDDGTATSGATAVTEEATGETMKTGEAEVIELSADPTGQLKYEQTELTAKEGDIVINLTNESSVAHDVEVESADGDELGTSEQIAEGSTKLELKDVQAGDYEFYCTVPGHRDAGMEGTLSVN